MNHEPHRTFRHPRQLRFVALASLALVARPAHADDTTPTPATAPSDSASPPNSTSEAPRAPTIGSERSTAPGPARPLPMLAPTGVKRPDENVFKIEATMWW